MNLAAPNLVVLSASEGAALQYTLNRHHLAAQPVLALLGLRRTLARRLTSALEEWGVQPYHASLFGSASRCDGGTDGVIDVFLVRPPGLDAEAPGWRSDVDALSAAVLRWTGNRAGIAEVSIGDVQRLKRERPAIVENLECDVITLVGIDVHQLFAAAEG